MKGWRGVSHGCAALLLACGFAATAAADFPVGQVLTVSIESVDPAKQLLTFTSIRTGESFTAHWSKSTRFARGPHLRLGPEVLQKGARADVLYSTPTFGEPFVARVTILESK